MIDEEERHLLIRLKNKTEKSALMREAAHSLLPELL